MPIVYGPVPSWRLGRSLGIDLTPARKTCTFSCVYCQLGRTTRKVSSPEQVKIKISKKTLLTELKEVLNSLAPGAVDVITFSGTGEPTLNLELGKMISSVKKLAGGVPIAVLTNSSLLERREVRRNLSKADMVVAKLDAPTQVLFRAINRPARGITLAGVLKGLRSFGEEFMGRLIIQTMLFASREGKANNFRRDTIIKLADLIRPLNPHELQLNTPTRPPAERHVRALTRLELKRVKRLFQARLPRVRIVSAYERAVSLPVEWRRHLELAQGIESLLERRPCQVHDIAGSLGVSPQAVRESLEKLIKDGKIHKLRVGRKVFYRAA